MCRAEPESTNQQQPPNKIDPETVLTKMRFIEKTPAKTPALPVSPHRSGSGVTQSQRAVSVVGE